MTETAIPDVQSSPDKRHIAINRVGIRDLRLPLFIENAAGEAMPTVARAALMVALPHTQKGTHMSRFIRLLDLKMPISVSALPTLHQKMLDTLHAEEGTISLSFPFFIEKSAPVSGEKALLDYEVVLTVDGNCKHAEVSVEVTVPVTSLCPCSKEISQYGAHNQRSHIVIYAQYNPNQPFSIEDLIHIAEEGASCPIWSLLKRPDEKYITERAYEHPKFVEDIVRDIAMVLNDDPRISFYRISSENFESIHNHSAFALIEHQK